MTPKSVQRLSEKIMLKQVEFARIIAQQRRRGDPFRAWLPVRPPSLRGQLIGSQTPGRVSRLADRNRWRIHATALARVTVWRTSKPSNTGCSR
jgi:hypothetical protein